VETGVAFYKAIMRTFLLLLIPLVFTGCLTVPPMAPVDLLQPGWTVREGQAVWCVKRGEPEIAVEIVLATRPDGREFVQLTKNPFPLAVAQATTNSWEVRLPTENKRYSGRGEPPARLILLYIPKVLAGESPPKGWTWQVLPENGWRLENRESGESLEGFFTK
jgi:hypothetical protein